MSVACLDNFKTLVTNLKPVIQNYSKKRVRLSDLHKTNRQFFWGDASLNQTSLKDLLNLLSIKNSLVEEINSDENQWKPLQKCLTDIKQDRTVTVVQVEQDGTKEVARVLDTDISDTNFNLDRGIDLISNYLENQTQEFDIRKVNFNTHSLQLEVQLHIKDDLFDVFGDNNDLWGTGISISYGETKLNVSPYFWRKICSNGITVNHMAFQRYYENRIFKQNSFNRLISNTLNKDLKALAKQNCKRLLSNNTSLREYYGARNILSTVSPELAQHYFNDEHIKEAYKSEKIYTKNSRWLSTANSNINAYDFFNKITHCVTHQNLQDKTRIELNQSASEIFFKGPDFCYKAPDPFIS
jgi:hypothetical protein